MTEEEKELLLIDLCARLPYNVFCEISDADEPYKLETIRFNGEYFLFNNGVFEKYITEIKPYLRPMSSMTDEEKKVYKTISAWGYVLESRGHRTGIYPTIEGYKWLNANYFDYHHLIEKGLALPAPKGMYN